MSSVHVLVADAVLQLVVGNAAGVGDDLHVVDTQDRVELAVVRVVLGDVLQAGLLVLGIAGTSGDLGVVAAHRLVLVQLVAREVVLADELLGALDIVGDSAGAGLGVVRLLTDRTTARHAEREHEDHGCNHDDQSVVDHVVRTRVHNVGITRTATVQRGVVVVDSLTVVAGKVVVLQGSRQVCTPYCSMEPYLG